MKIHENELGATKLEKERSIKYPKLFHYTSVDGLKGIIDSKSLWATKIQYLNDSKEFTHAIEIAQQIINSKKITSPDYIKYLEILERDLASTNRGANTFIFSFTEQPDQLSQWRGYCNYDGYSIGFNKDHIAEIGKKQKYKLIKCIYDDTKKLEIIEKLINDAMSFYSVHKANKEIEEIARESLFFHNFLELGATIKHSSFVEENEWRLIGGIFKSKDIQWRTKQGILLPYHIFELQKDKEGYLPIIEVYIGPTKQQSLAAESLRLYMQHTNNLFRIQYSKTPYRE